VNTQQRKLQTSSAEVEKARCMRRPRWSLWALLATASLLLPACSGSLLPKPDPLPARFSLDRGSAAATAHSAAPGAADLTVDLPRAAPGYDSTRMLYMRRPLELEAFAFHEWVAPPAQMLSPLLLRALQQGGSFRIVLAAAAAAPTRWRLQTELLRLHQDFTQRPSRVRLSVRVLLLNGVTRQALAQREFDIVVPAARDDPVAGAVAAQAATQQWLEAVAAFCREQVQLQAQIAPTRARHDPP